MAKGHGVDLSLHELLGRRESEDGGVLVTR